MKKFIISIISGLFALCIIITSLTVTIVADGSSSVSSGDNKNSIDYAYQQTIIEFLMPQIEQAVTNYYKDYFNYLPGVAPYYGGKVLSIQHRDSEPEKNIPYSYELVIQVVPYFGPHISVGKDNLTFRVFAGGKAQLEKFEHVESHEIPQRYSDIIINKWPPEK
jgi:hypothetical protein